MSERTQVPKTVNLTPSGSAKSALYRVSLRDPIGSRYANRPQGHELHHVYIDAESRSDAVQKAAEAIKQWMLATEADQCETFWARKDNIVLPSPNDQAHAPRKEKL
jgi:hypothetical protein